MHKIFPPAALSVMMVLLLCSSCQKMLDPSLTLPVAAVASDLSFTNWFSPTPFDLFKRDLVCDVQRSRRTRTGSAVVIEQFSKDYDSSGLVSGIRFLADEGIYTASRTLLPIRQVYSVHYTPSLWMPSTSGRWGLISLEFSRPPAPFTMNYDLELNSEGKIEDHQVLRINGGQTTAIPTGSHLSIYNYAWVNGDDMVDHRNYSYDSRGNIVRMEQTQSDHKIDPLTLHYTVYYSYTPATTPVHQFYPVYSGKIYNFSVLEYMGLVTPLAPKDILTKITIVYQQAGKTLRFSEVTTFSNHVFNRENQLTSVDYSIRTSPFIAPVTGKILNDWHCPPAPVKLWSVVKG